MLAYHLNALSENLVPALEDSGDVFLESTDAKVPDYRTVTKEGEQFLVEVKNCHKTDPSSKFSIKTSYLEGLISYANLLNLKLKIAIYWSRWNKWTLISPVNMKKRGASHFTTYIDSCMQNQMATLGDVMIGTTPPLGFRVLTDGKKPRLIGKDGKVEFTIGQVEMSCAGNQIVDHREQGIAFYIMLYGDWTTDEPTMQIEGNELIAIDYFASPPDITPGQGFEIVGTLSGMISRRYNELTAPSGQIERLAPKVEPGVLGIAIPSDYKGKQLPLWRFIQEPSLKEADKRIGTRVRS